MALADSTHYDPWGTVTTGTQRRIGYQGDYTDPTTGQVNMTARWYEPGTGTFTSRDDAGLPASPSGFANRYGYGAAAPTNYTDPSVHIPVGPNPCAPVPGKPSPAICIHPGGGAGSGLGPGVGGLPESVVEPATAAHPNAADRTWTTSYDEPTRPPRPRRPWPRTAVRGNSPTCAGTTQKVELGKRAGKDQSRVRGDDANGTLVRPLPMGPAPRARGQPGERQA